MFIDKAKIRYTSGKGGDGAVSFHREKYVAAGGPDGGDGGRGGNVYFVVDKNMSTLEGFRYKKKYKAEDGENGRNKNCTGKSGEDLYIKVPEGTIVRDAESGKIIADLSGNEPILLAKGGKGGAGNQHFATSTRQIPRFAKMGGPSESFEVILELKLLADVGLVGFPNVGKSTFISVVSAAKPKIANYHFTTLTPVLGVVSVSDEESFVMADIPGLIEGAGDGIGLGHEFLRHVDRCRLIVHVVDVSGCEGRDPKEDFETINRELEKYSPELALRPQIVIGNKCDIASREQIDEFKAFVTEKGYQFFETSVATGKGAKEVVYAVYEKLKALPPITKYEVEYIPEAEDKNSREFNIVCEDGVYYIEGEWLLQVLNDTNPDDYESLHYFQRVLRKSGIIDRLEEMGINEGDICNIYDFEFEYIR
ncbi:MAG: GTPase ObgE [Oscillospiraceae bacterium]|nr:GTPase ObgE [Oscillospiraceae bacterium]